MSAALALAIVALFGPWVFDRINVPAQYTCSPPHVRLEGDFCGLPLSGAWVFAMVVEMFVGLAVGLGSGESGLTGRFREVLFATSILWLAIPLFTTLACLLRPQSRRWGRINLIGWVMGLMASGYFAVAGGFIGLPGLRHLWGLWLYIAVAIVMIATEIRWAKTPERSGLPVD